MTPGALDQRVTVQSYARTSDGGGGSTVAWSNLATVWAHVQPRAGREDLEDQQTQAQIGYRFTIRNRSDVDETMRVVWRGDNYNIRAVMSEGSRPLYLTIDAERGAADLE